MQVLAYDHPDLVSSFPGDPDYRKARQILSHIEQIAPTDRVGRFHRKTFHHPDGMSCLGSQSACWCFLDNNGLPRRGIEPGLIPSRLLQGGIVILSAIHVIECEWAG